MLWVKGELLTDVDAPGIDPTGQLERSAQAVLFNRRAWFRRIRQHGCEAPLIGRAASEGALCWLFLKRDERGRASSLSNWYSFAFRPVFSGDPDSQRQRAMLVAIAKRLRSARPRIAAIMFSPVPDADGSAGLLQNALRTAGWLTFSREVSVSWTASVTGQSFADYWAARPGQLRNTLKRKLAKADFDTQVFTHFDADAWSAYEKIYEESWKPDEGQPEFLRELAIDEAKAGCLRLGLCRVNGEAIAAQLWTVENGVALIHKLAHREGASELSPGTILSAAMFCHVIDEDKVHTIDFGTGNDRYKADWMDSCAPLIRIDAHNPATMAGLWGAAKTRLSRLVRRPSDR